MSDETPTAEPVKPPAPPKPVTLAPAPDPARTTAQLEDDYADAYNLLIAASQDPGHDADEFKAQEAGVAKLRKKLMQARAGAKTA